MTLPLVSILIPVYNCKLWVAHAVESALAQTWPNKDIIVLDDASTDGTLGALEAFRSSIRIERASVNGGQNVSRNRLTAMSRGEWLVYLDADDELAPDCIEKKMSRAENADAVFGTVELRFYNGNSPVRSEVLSAQNFPDPLAAAFQWRYPNTSSFIFRRQAILDVGGWNETIKNCTDYDIYFKLLLSGKRLSAAPESLTIYRHWSRTQAVNERPERKMFTRLEVMWKAALELESKCRLTPQVREAFAASVLSVIRSLYSVNRARALAEYQRLIDWYPRYQPSTNLFPAGYCLTHRLFGFAAAEQIAALTRFSRARPWTPDFLR